jgi:polysaccharide biosynthesis transport protein
VDPSPTRYELPPSDRWALQDDRAVGPQPGPGAVWAVVVRNRLLILACTAVVAGAAAFYTSRQTPIFEASTTLRIRFREPSLTDVYGTMLNARGDIETEIAVLQSRALKENAAAVLGLQLDILEPERTPRGELARTISVGSDAPAGEYRLVRRPDARFDIFGSDSVKPISLSGPDGTVHLPGATFVLTPAARGYEQLRIGVSSLPDAVGRLGDLWAAQLSRDADIVTLSASNTDSLMAAEAPNLIAGRYIAYRREIEKSKASSAARFLREQLRRVNAELGEAEDDFRTFKERERVLDPSVQTSNEVARLIAKESERSSLEAERQALSKSLAEIDSAGSRPGAPSPYRRLVGLPFLLRNGAASALLSALVTAENEKAALVSATSEDPDMRVVTAKIRNLEDQLRSITQTYLQGVANQVSSLDATLGTFAYRLNTIPKKQLEYARRQRQVESLEAVHNLLQTRLNEAEIAESVEDATVAVLDSAVTPSSPSSPKPLINLAAGMAVGIMLGVCLACVREFRDHSVHSRRDVLVATGVPVLGLIPRIPETRGRIALITGRRRLKSGGTAAASELDFSRRAGQRSFTFLGPDPRSHDAELPALAHNVPRRLTTSELELTVSRWTNVVAEAYSLLLTNITFARTTPPIKVVVITSPLAEDGKTTCAVNLAITLALRGSKALLVDADLRRGVVHTTLGGERSPGLSEVLSGSLSVREVIRSIKVGEHGGQLHFVPTGKIPGNPSALLESSAFQNLVGQMRDEYDTVILDAPPVNIISDASVLGLNADAVLMVARSGVTEAAALTYAVEQLTRVGVPLLGVVLNDIDFKREAVYDPSYRSYSPDQYASAAGES